MLLGSLLDLNNGENIAWHLCKEDFEIPSHIHLDLYDQRILVFSKFCSGFDLRFVCLEESSIFEAFTDFFSSLEESGLIYSIEETNAIVQRYMAQL